MECVTPAMANAELVSLLAAPLLLLRDCLCYLLRAKPFCLKFSSNLARSCIANSP